MDRTFILISKEEMNKHGIVFGDDMNTISKSLSEEDGVLYFDDLYPKFHMVDKTSSSVPFDLEDSGLVVGWDIESGQDIGRYFGKFGNLPALAFLQKYGHSIDMDPLADKSLSKDDREKIKEDMLELLREEQPDGKKIKDFSYEDFIQYSRDEINYFGETASPLLAMAVGSRYFSNTVEANEKDLIPNGNYEQQGTRAGLSMDVFDFIAREFPGELAIQKDNTFLNGHNKDVNRSALYKTEIPQVSVISRLGSSLAGAVNALSPKSLAPTLK